MSIEEIVLNGAEETAISSCIIEPMATCFYKQEKDGYTLYSAVNGTFGQHAPEEKKLAIVIDVLESDTPEDVQRKVKEAIRQK